MNVITSVPKCIQSWIFCLF